MRRSATLVEEATGIPASVGNDASLGAIAEHLFGAGRGVDDMVYLNGGASGIGGGLIVHGCPSADPAATPASSARTGRASRPRATGGPRAACSRTK